MDIVRQAIARPITVAVGVIFVVMFGLLALSKVPVQLTPDVDRPRVTVTTLWPGASPQEIEREIVDEQEEQLKRVDGVIKMESTSSDSVGSIVLEFPVGTSIESAMLRVSNRLDQVPSYPTDAEKPVIVNVDTNSQAMAWFMVSALPGTDIDPDTLYDFLDDEVKPAFERVPGVAQANIVGGRQREMQVVMDRDRLAMRRLTMTQVAAALTAENQDYSAGDFDAGKRRYVVRTTGDYRSAADIDNVIVARSDNGAPIYVRDIGHAVLTYHKKTGFVREKGVATVAMNCQREAGTNILHVMEGVRATARKLDAELLRPRGLALEQVYDQTDYIVSAIGLVRSNIFVGGALAVLVLLLFLRSISGTFIVALSIPISVIATFLIMSLVGRSINVISLAGLAFAVGMVVDNCIVVLENVFRHREMGKRRRDASHDGATEVWGAVLASTLTTVAVFLPVIFVAEEAGQLFRDIAIAVSAAVLLSLIVSVTVIPTLAARILGRESAETKATAAARRGAIGRFFAAVPAGIGAGAAWINRSTSRRLAVIVGLTTVSIGGSWLLMPKTEYLPTGNSNFVLGMLQPPPGYNVDENLAIAEEIVEPALARYWEAEPGTPEAEVLEGGGLRNLFYVSFGNRTFVGLRANDDQRVFETVPLLQEVLSRVPGSIAVAFQSSIFSQGLQTGRSINVDIRGPRIEDLIAVGGRLFSTILEKIPGVQGQPIPGLDLGSPEIRLVPDRRRMADVNLTNRDLGFTVNALVDGVKIDDYRIGGREIDLVLKGNDSPLRSSRDLAAVPINTPDGKLVTLGSVARIEPINGPVQIQHIERQRAIRLAMNPPDGMPLEEAMDIIENQIVAPLRTAGLPAGVSIGLTGTADDLVRTRDALLGNFLLALAITYLLMAALFQSWVYPLVIIFSVPLATFGGFLGLAIVHAATGQALDVLTMLGFVILIGIVVNNAILIVHQSLNLIRNGSPAAAAIPEAVASRVRPIFMSTLTSIFGMLPLVLFPGAGSELYRGLGSVVVGGLALSTVFTLVLVPALFSLTVDARAHLARLFGSPVDAPDAPKAAGA
ncbi:MAG: efflux RND transporter permease subunit [Acidobacteriota bacterium]